MKKLLLLAFLIVLAASCRKIETLSTVPHIEFRNFEIFDTIDILGNRAKGGRLKFYFEDGDGDVGLHPPDKAENDTNDLRLSLYRKQGGVIVPALPNDPLRPSSYRIPYIEREGQNKIVKGTVAVTILYLFYAPSDTIIYEFYIVDRSKNKSNIVTTKEIPVFTNGIY
ncbi:MAG TPA: hypothetical protein VK213_08825 [Bacteroidales bacterium]|nr:hypothetical protein [Bacteroidales bacterium]